MKNKTSIMAIMLASLSILITGYGLSSLTYEGSGSASEMSYADYLLQMLEQTSEFLRNAAPLVAIVFVWLLVSVLAFVACIALFRNIIASRNSIADSFQDRIIRLFTGSRENKKGTESPLQPGVAEFNKLIEYSRKRKEIEEEMKRLTDMLTKSDVPEFADVDRLVISGQNLVWTNGTIDYQRFCKRFGISPDELKVRENVALFLTPFTPLGDRAFRVCQYTLNQLGIVLQMTDNVVNKDDILMNIVTKILEASFLIVNIDGRNPNVYYELGIAHALGKPTILISESSKPEAEHGFDVRQKNMILYRDEMELERKLLYRLNELRMNE